MTTKVELIKQIDEYFSGTYDITNGTVVPNVDEIAFGKVGREIELAMLFIDIRESTKIVDGFRRITAARMYKSFIWGVARIAKNNGGELRSFNGDGILVVFSGDYKCNHAAKAALQMAWFFKKVLKPEVEAYMKNNSKLQDIELSFGVGIDVGKVLIVRGGFKGENNNDLVWIGNATNYAVKLSGIKGLEEDNHIFISEAVYKNLNNSSKFGGDPERNMWEKRVWTAMDNMSIYRSAWTWEIS